MKLKDLKVVFMGTPEFSVPVLNMLIKETNVIGVVTQPDKEVGRDKEIKYSPVKNVAIKENIKVLQPIKIRNEYEDILALKPDIIITCAYGQIIPTTILDYPEYGCINVHASLLPYLRGGAPIHKAIIDGYDKTGITIMYMDPKMDNGNIISQSEIPILDSDNVGTLHDKLSDLGVKLLKETLPSIIKKTNKSIKQDEKLITFAYNITRDDEHINFNKTAKEVFNHIRGLNPWPVGYVILDNKIVKLYNSYIGEFTSDNIVGSINHIYENGIGVACLDKEIIITEIKFEGKKKMSVKDYLNGIDKDSLIGRIFN